MRQRAATVNRPDQAGQAVGEHNAKHNETLRNRYVLDWTLGDVHENLAETLA